MNNETDPSPAPVQHLVGQDLDLIVLEEFEREFEEIDGWRHERLERRLNKCGKQVEAILNKRRFMIWIECGVTARSGWLSEKCKERLRYLRELKRQSKPNSILDRQPPNTQADGQ